MSAAVNQNNSGKSIFVEQTTLTAPAVAAFLASISDKTPAGEQKAFNTLLILGAGRWMTLQKHNEGKRANKPAGEPKARAPKQQRAPAERKTREQLMMDLRDDDDDQPAPAVAPEPAKAAAAPSPAPSAPSAPAPSNVVPLGQVKGNGKANKVVESKAEPKPEPVKPEPAKKAAKPEPAPKSGTKASAKASAAKPEPAKSKAAEPPKVPSKGKPAGKTFVVHYNPGGQTYAADGAKTEAEARAEALKSVPGLVEKKIIRVSAE